MKAEKKGKKVRMLIGIGIALIVIGAGLCTAGLIRRHAAPPASPSEDAEMLIEYCRKVVGTVGGDRYAKTVLYRNADGSLEVHYFSKHESDKEEAHSAYRADPSVLDDAYALIRRYGMQTWNDRKFGAGPDGAVYSLQFRNEDGSCTYVSSGNMPPDGHRKMGEVEDCLSSKTVGEDLLAE